MPWDDIASAVGIMVGIIAGYELSKATAKKVAKFWPIPILFLVGTVVWVSVYQHHHWWDYVIGAIYVLWTWSAWKNWRERKDNSITLARERRPWE